MLTKLKTNLPTILTYTGATLAWVLLTYIAGTLLSQTFNATLPYPTPSNANLLEILVPTFFFTSSTFSSVFALATTTLVVNNTDWVLSHLKKKVILSLRVLTVLYLLWVCFVTFYPIFLKG